MSQYLAPTLPKLLLICLGNSYASFKTQFEGHLLQEAFSHLFWKKALQSCSYYNNGARPLLTCSPPFSRRRAGSRFHNLCLLLPGPEVALNSRAVVAGQRLQKGTGADEEMRGDEKGVRTPGSR